MKTERHRVCLYHPYLDSFGKTKAESCFWLASNKLRKSRAFVFYNFMHVKYQQMGFGFFIAAFSILVFDMQLPALFTSSNKFVIICHKMFI